jgi:aryl sulfotransferase
MGQSRSEATGAAVEGPAHRYRSDDEDSNRWRGFPYRHGDIVISTRSKSGTTWVQMICALLIFQTPDLPQPLGELSPWLDWLGAPRHEVYARLSAQTHRRFVKTHTPLDGLPLDRRATYVVVGRHPLDMAVSLYHQGDNIDRVRQRQLTGRPEPTSSPPPRPALHEWLLWWIDWDADPRRFPDSLPGVLAHVSDAWTRVRSEAAGGPKVVLLHYDDLSADLEGTMRRLAATLGIVVDSALWPTIVSAADFSAMRARARDLAPDATGILKSPTAFFRRGSSGAAREVLSEGEWSHYRDRVATRAAPDLLQWLHHDGQLS